MSFSCFKRRGVLRTSDDMIKTQQHTQSIEQFKHYDKYVEFAIISSTLECSFVKIQQKPPEKRSGVYYEKQIHI